MKTKIIHLSIVAIMFLGCSKDNDSEEIQIEIPADEKLLGSIDGFYGSRVNLVYNLDKTVRNVDLGSAFIVDFTYESNRIATVEIAAGGQLLKCAFAYTAEGNIASFSMGETLIQVDYDPISKSYTYIDQLNQEEFTILLTPDEDIRQMSVMNLENGDTDSVVFTYDNEKNGTLTNSTPIILYLIIAFGEIDFWIYTFPFTKKPVKQISTTTVFSYPLENSYDQQGFMMSTKATNALYGEMVNNDGLSYNYISLD